MKRILIIILIVLVNNILFAKTNVKVKETKEYFLEDGKEKLMSTSKFYYDKKGNLIRKEQYDNTREGKLFLLTECKYDKNSNKIEEKIITINEKERKMFSKRKYEFNQKNQCIEERISFGDNSKEYIYVTTYDKEGNKILTQSLTEDSLIRYKYDNKKVIEKHDISSSKRGRLEISVYYEYDKRGNLTDEIQFNFSTEFGRRAWGYATFYKYNKDNLLTEKSKWKIDDIEDMDNAKIERIYSYTYDDKGVLKNEVSFIPKNGNLSMYSIEKYFY